MARVSIIIPAWCTEQFVGQAILSARTQSFRDVEIIVVNDYSSDDTEGAVRRAAENDTRVTLINHTVNQGPAAARNTALAAARGEWIAVLDADDAIAPDRIEKLLALAARENADIVADDLLLVNEALPPARKRHLGAARVETFSLATFARDNEMFSGRRQTGYLKPMFRAAFLARHTLRYDPAVRIGEDYMFVANALALGARYALLPEALYHYSVREGSISRTLSAADLNLLIAADDRFQARFINTLDPATKTAVQRRRASLEDAGAFIGAVEALKQHNFGAALSSALRRPASLRHFGMPIGARVARLISLRERSPETSHD